MATATDHQNTQLEKELKTYVKGEVSFDNDYKALYATDSSNYRQIPAGVVFPKDKEDIINTVAICRKHDMHLLIRGGGTSLAGQSCNTGVVMDFTRHYNKILDIDLEKKTARIQTGLVLDELNSVIKKHNLIFGPDPATHNHCSFGGMIGNNSCGIHSVMAQVEDGGIRTEDYVDSMEVLTYDGEMFEVGETQDEELEQIMAEEGTRGKIYRQLKELRDEYEDDIRNRIPQIARRVSGYSLDELLPENNFNVGRALVGTESTCAIFLEATIRLIKEPKERALLVLGYDSVFDAGNHVPEIMKYKPIGLEGLDDKLIGYMETRGLNTDHLPLLPQGDGWLLVEFGADSKEKAVENASRLMEDIKERGNGNSPDMRLYKEQEDQDNIWLIRESGLGATAFVKGQPDMWPGWEDSAVPVDRVGEYLHDLRDLFNKYDYHPSLYGHFGQGCIHCRVGFDLTTKEGIEKYKNFTEEATDLVMKYGGSISGEHGDGQARAELLHRMYGDRLLEAFHQFKEIWDPQWKMNPGKVIDPDPLDANLRLGTDFRPEEKETHFKYPEDQGSFHRATLRCVGVGECRKTNTGAMCPSFMATKDEKHVTRGRAHLLFEMMRGKELEGGWKSEEVKESLDLCLSCKACLDECPVNVDMATYKAEFLAHYYEGRVRPRAAYAFGLIDKWAEMAANMSGPANFLGQSEPFSKIIKSIGGIAPEREIPRFADKPFTKKYDANNKAKDPENAVMLWPDTFNNYFFPEVLEAAYKILEGAGFEVLIPEKKVCCGRPLYDYGMLDRAKSYLTTIMDDLSDIIQQGIPFVGLEASCVAVFRNELNNFFPTDYNAQRLGKNFQTLPEFIVDHMDRFDFKKLNQTAVLHRHCHHQAVMTYKAEAEVFKRIGLDLNIPDSGCCGMAGSFGFEEEKYDLSMQIGESRILPLVREMKEELLITDGFSCREQIRHGTGKMPEHTAEVILRAMK